MPPITKKMMDKISDFNEEPAKSTKKTPKLTGLHAFKVQKSTEEKKSPKNSQNIKRLL